jgi:hypothetical protein
MSEDPAMSDDPSGERRPAGPLWFLAERDAFLRRFILRTLLQPPPFVRRARRVRPRWLPR